MITLNCRLDEKLCETVLTQQLDDLLKKLVILQSRPGKKSIHDTRVQSRRMRAALEAFQELFNPGPYRALYGTIRQVTRTLGKPRETRVVLDLIRNMNNAGDMAEGICREYLVERMEIKLRKQERRLLRNLKAIDPPQLQSQLQFLLAGLESHASNYESESSAEHAQTQGHRRSMQKPFQPMLFRMHESNRERAQRIFKELAQPVLSFRTRYQFHRATDDRLHEMRIAAKKLRYAMENFDPLWPHGLKDQIGDARELQDAGGEYHDWCVLCGNLKAEIRRFHKGDNAHLVFQIGRLLAFAEDRKAELRKKVLPAITTLQSTLLLMLPDLGNEPEPEKQLTAATELERK